MSTPVKKIYILAGEPSGDLHGSFLVRSLLKKQSDLNIRAWGGDLMQAAGANVVKHYRELAFMGFAEVLANLGKILKNFRVCKSDIRAFQPDIVVLIDYPGFNLRMAQWLNKNDFKIIYYIAPQVWAWKENRVKKIKKYVNELVVILPFERQFFKKHGIDATYVGHPLMEVIFDYQNMEGKDEVGKAQSKLQTVALLPGSRTQEIKHMLPVMLSVVKNFSNCRFIIAGASAQPKDLYQSIIDSPGLLAPEDKYRITLESNKTYSILRKADAALVTSGTATLETALFRVPQVVCYKSSWLSYQIAKRLIRVKYISLVNLILNRLFLTELIQNEMNPKALTEALSKILAPENQHVIQSGYDDLQKALLQDKKPSELTADVILRQIEKD
jgi:lipid-A-disaccharide synthase